MSEQYVLGIDWSSAPDYTVWRCVTCGATFDQRDDIEAHVAEHAPRRGVEPPNQRGL